MPDDLAPWGYYEGLTASSLMAGWARRESSAGSRSKMQTHVWRAAEARAALQEASKFVGTDVAERRNLIMVNPAPGNAYATTRNLVAAYQMIQPGETARSHRHTPAALRLVLDATNDVYTVVDGKRVDMTPGDVVLTEALTFPGTKAAAARLGVKLVGVAMDEGGIVPDALVKACRTHKPKAVYLIPTLHNPTTATLSAERRGAIAKIIRDAGIVLIEDDAYGLLDRAASPIANLIPERTYLATTLSKCIAPALRVAYLLTPDSNSQQEMRGYLQANVQMPAPLMVALVTHWLENGIADRIIAAIRNEAVGRQQLAQRALKGFQFMAKPAAHHLWLTLPDGRPDVAAHLLRNGLAVVAGDAFAVEGIPPHAARVSLGAARNRPELTEALRILVGALHRPADTRQIV